MRTALTIFMTWSALALAPAAAMAEEPGDAAHQEEGHGGAHHATEPPPINWYHWHYGKDVYGGELEPGEEPMAPPVLFALINFAVFLGILIKFAGPKLATYLRVRHETVKSQLDEAASLRAQARAKLDEYNRRIAGLDQEVSKLLHEIRAEAEAERETIVAQARAQAEAMKREAEARIESEIARVRHLLEREVVTAAVAVAEKVLSERTTPDDQSRLFEGFIANLVAAGSGGGDGGDGGPGRRKRRTTVDEEWGQ